MPTRVKICGITRPVDALAAERFGADALGFVFFPGSSRFVSPETVRTICRELSPLVCRIGVFVNRSRDFIFQTVLSCGLSAVQLSGDEPPGFLADAPFPVIRAVRVGGKGDLLSLARYRPGSTLVLDSCAPGVYGGTGLTFDWDHLTDDLGAYRIIIAGGLTPENVGHVLGRFRPSGVDVASGVEQSPGIKDHNKMRRFIHAVRRYGGTTDETIS